MNPYIVGLMLNSVTFTLLTFIAGLVTDHPTAWRLSILCFGVRFAAIRAMLTGWRHFGDLLAWIATLSAIAGFIDLCLTRLPPP